MAASVLNTKRAAEVSVFVVRAFIVLRQSVQEYTEIMQRLADAGPADPIRFDDSKKEYLQQYLDGHECAPYRKALQNACDMIDGFQSPLGLELLATVDWLIKENEYPATIDGIRQGLQHWPESKSAAERKQRILDDRLIDLALKRLLPLSS